MSLMKQCNHSILFCCVLLVVCMCFHVNAQSSSTITYMNNSSSTILYSSNDIVTLLKEKQEHLHQVSNSLKESSILLDAFKAMSNMNAFNPSSHASYEADKQTTIRELHALKQVLEFEISNIQLLLNTSSLQKQEIKQDQLQQDNLMLKDQEKRLKELEMKLKEEQVKQELQLKEQLKQAEAMKLKEELEKKAREGQAKFGELNQSTLLNSKQLDRFTNEIMKGIPSSNDGKKLLFKASRDGFSAKTFHSKCDNKGPTVVIVKSTSGAVFGGYSSILWDSSNIYVQDRAAFLFSLISSNNEERFTKLTQENSYFYKNIQKSYSNAKYDADRHGPTFGGGHDLHISDNANLPASASGSYSQLCYSYCDSNMSYGSETSKTYLAGSLRFKVEDYEVYSW